ncbi:MAG TPA: PBP1A family penicillin-binding protein [Bryobacteraceae bacterium]|nr:PBP1A family penicillin-binding protein [Bryobacteraceae bacterium]
MTSKLPPWRSAAKWLLAGAALLTVGLAAFAIPYLRLAKRVDEQLRAGAFQHTFTYLASPQMVSVGDPVSPTEVSVFQRFGVHTVNGQVASIADPSSNRPVLQTEIPALPIIDMSGEGRVKSRMLKYAEIPPVLVHAVISAEDKRFFEHSGLDFLRILKATYVDLKDHRKEQGASTISMQLARNLWLGHDKRWSRKIAEALITLHLEQKLSKQEIFEDYCNVVYLGNEGSFSVSGFGEAARVYFNKDMRKLDLAESATLAGLIQRPSYLNPFHHPERALERRNLVLSLMYENKYISKAQYKEAAEAPLGLHPAAGELSEAAYFMDLAGNQAARELDERPSGSAKVYTTLDPRLQQAAEQSIADGMRLVDKILDGRRKKGQTAGPRPQVALIALDPHTGEVKALCGGRDYALSQLNRVLSKRPPGSVFKPFVYAAALNTAVVGGSQVFTPASTVDDSPTTFEFANQTYSPNNFKGEFRGMVTFRQALAHSLNVATVKVGEMVGFDTVAALATQSGLSDVGATPALALGAYQETPLAIARAYTVFANGGARVQPTFLAEINDRNGTLLYRHTPQTKRVLDPRVAFLMVDMLQEVMRSGTAAGVRARGFRLPAAGKTGTSHDGWFAGFTSNLLCVVWVGFDDYSELGLEGARSALPIWTEFMQQAARYKQYGNARPFAPPPGLVNVGMDLASGQACPGGAMSFFIAGTEPTSECAPQQIEVNFTPEGGAEQRIVPVAAVMEHPAAQN